jgi:hypothetical protein
MAKSQTEAIHVGEREISLFDFNTLLPMPKELEGTKSPGDDPNWYDWRIEHWGTKWDADGVSVEWVLNENKEHALFYSFLTAWGPPDKLLKAIAPLFPTLTFDLRSCDPAMDWDYILTCHGNEVKEVEISPLDDDSKEYWGLEQEEYEDDE